MLPMNRTGITRLRLLACLVALGFPTRTQAAEATFLRALNLNGPAREIDGRKWDGSNAANVSVEGKLFENQAVALKPATDPARATRWASQSHRGAGPS